MLVALAFLPEEEVISGFDMLKSHPNYDATNMKQSFDYFETMYIRKKDRRRRHKPAMFPVGDWNTFSRLAEGLRRTNNAVEGFHNKLQKTIGANPTIWEFIEGLQNMEAVQKGVYLAVLVGKEPYTKKPIYQEINQNHTTLAATKHTRSMYEYLEGVAHNVRLYE